MAASMASVATHASSEAEFLPHFKSAAPMNEPAQIVEPANSEPSTASPGFFENPIENGSSLAPEPIAAPSSPVFAEGSNNSNKVPDPLADSPEVVWYVRPPTGGQFGPATSEIIRGWLAEGRISIDTLVWREGWRDWLEAGGVFPQLNLPFTNPLTALNTPPQPLLVPQQMVTPSLTATHPAPKSILWLITGLSALTLLVIATALYFWLVRP
jgi:hypothetical protein